MTDTPYKTLEAAWADAALAAERDGIGADMIGLIRAAFNAGAIVGMDIALNGTARDVARLIRDLKASTGQAISDLKDG